MRHGAPPGLATVSRMSTSEGVAPAPAPPARAELLELAEVAAGLGRLDLRAVLRGLTDTGSRLTGAEHGAFFSTGEDADGERLDAYAVSGSGGFPAATPVRSTALFAPTFAGGDVVRVDDVLADARYGGGTTRGLPAGHPAVRSYLAVPVVTGDGRVIGGMLYGHREPGRFDAGAEVAALAVAAHAATAAENARLLGDAHRARELAERTASRVELLQRITALLSTASTTAEITRRVPTAVSRALGCSGSHVLLLDEEHLALVGTPSDVFPAGSRRAFAAVPLDSGTPSTRAVLTRRPVRMTHADLARLDRLGATAEPLPPEVASIVAVPLLDRRRRALGALATVWPDGAGEGPEVTDLLVAVAGQVSQALERARLLDAEREARSQLVDSVAALTDVARTLQRSLLPRRLPDLERVQVAVRYLPAVSGAEAGGDWYDVVPTGDDDVTVVIGDVQGHSTTAAGLMGQLRMAVRAYLTEGHEPAAALERTNELLLAMDTGLFATCCLVRLDQATGDLVVATAGHPPPLVLGADGAVTEVDVEPGLPLGVAHDLGCAPARLRLCGPSSLVMYTDGVVESPTDDGDRGLDAVRAAVLASRGLGSQALADRVMAGIPHRLADDAALLALDYAGPRAHRDQVTIQLPPDLAAVAGARAFLRHALLAWDVPEDVRDSAELVVSELVTNAVTHTGTAAELVVARESGAGLLRISVADRSSRHPAPRDAAPDAVGGRGLAIVEVLAQAWGVTAHGEGKLVWAVLPLSGG